MKLATISDNGKIKADNDLGKTEEEDRNKAFEKARDRRKDQDSVKIIVHNKNDLIFAENQSKKVNKSCKLFLQPEWGNKQKMIPIIVDHVMKNPKWKISLQTHKYIGVE